MISRIAWSAWLAATGWLRRLVAASIAWTNASAPVSAVSAGGRLRVRSGSSKASAGLSASPQAQTLWPARSVNTAVRVTSAPVPAVVGRAITGKGRAGSGRAIRA